MRSANGLTMAFLLLAGAGCGEKEPEIFGRYELVSHFGEPVPTEMVSSGWMELQPGGAWELSLLTPAHPDPMRLGGEFSLGEMTDGCTPVVTRLRHLPEETESYLICGETMTHDNQMDRSVFRRLH